MIVFVAALKQELAAFGEVVAIDRREQVDGVPLAEGHADGVAVALVQSGIGRQRASEATRLAIARYRPDMIVSVGYSGGLSPEIRGSDLVLGQRLLVAEPASPGGELHLVGEPIEVEPSLLDTTAIAMEESLLTARSGDFVTVPAIVRGYGEKDRLRRRSSALLVDMESYWVALAAREAEVPFVAARVASDEIGDTLPDFTKFADAMGGIRPLPAAWYYLTHPHHVLGAGVLAYNARQGARNLAAFAALFLTIAFRGAPVRR